MKSTILFKPNTEDHCRNLLALHAEVGKELKSTCRPWSTEPHGVSYLSFSDYRMLYHLGEALAAFLTQRSFSRSGFLLLSRNRFGDSGEGFDAQACNRALDVLEVFLENPQMDFYESTQGQFLPALLQATAKSGIPV